LRMRTTLVVAGLFVLALPVAISCAATGKSTGKATSQRLGDGPTLYVSPIGSDSADCMTPANACATFNAAFQKTADGETIIVGSGTYDARSASIYPNPRLTRLVTFRPAGPVTFANGVRILASHVEMDGFTYGYTLFPNGDGGTSHSYGLTIQPPSGAAGSYACVTDVVIADAVGHNFAVNNGTSNVIFIDSSWGGLGWAPGQRSNFADSWNAPAIGGSPAIHCPDATTTGPPAADISFERVRFGLDFAGCTAAPGDPANCQYPKNPCVDASGAPTLNCAAPSHTDCLHVFGETIGLRIENSIFEGCYGMYLNLNVESKFVVDGVARIKDAVIRNNWFGDDTPSAASTIQILRAGTGPLYSACDNVTFSNNTFSYGGANAVAIECPRAPGASVGVRFVGNIFARFGPSTDRTACGTRHPGDVTWATNYFDNGIVCGVAPPGAASRAVLMQNLPVGIGRLGLP
jgi:hypothetical protein